MRIRRGDTSAQVCVAHNVAGCLYCMRNPSTCALRTSDDNSVRVGAAVDRGCGTFMQTGMHWDTCPNRVRGPLTEEQMAELVSRGVVSAEEAKAVANGEQPTTLSDPAPPPPAWASQVTAPVPLIDGRRPTLMEFAGQMLTGTPDEREARMELAGWWEERAAREIGPIAEKAATYGSNSLAQMGRIVARLQNRAVSDEEALELGCWLYLIGKVERISDAILRGERAGDDSIHDARVYLGMMQRIRSTGTWPGPTEKDETGC